MKRLVAIISLLALIVTSSYCQITYPKKIVLDNDTCIVISKSQLVDVNTMLSYGLQNKEVNKILSTRLDSLECLDEVRARQLQNRDMIYSITNNELRSCYEDNKQIADINTSLRKQCAIADLNKKLWKSLSMVLMVATGYLLIK